MEFAMLAVMATEMNFNDFLLIRRNIVCSDWTNWDKFQEANPEMNISVPTVDRIVKIKDPLTDERKRNAASKDAVARALGFKTWWDAVRAWKSGKHPAEIPIYGVIVIEVDGTMIVEPAVDAKTKSAKRR